MTTSDPESVVELDVNTTVSDYARFIRWHSYHSTFSKVMLVVSATALLVLVLGLAVFGAGSAREHVGYLVVIFVVVAYWSAALPLWALVFAARERASHRSARETQHYTFSREGVSATSPSGSGRVEWSVYWKAVETKWSEPL